MFRLGLLAATIFSLTATSGSAQSISASGAQSASPPYEIVKRDTDLEADANGQYWQSDEVVYRPLTALGVESLQKVSLSYTSGYQSLAVIAYTLKKDGRKIDVPEDQILQGHGETTKPGFADTRTMMVVFPDLQIGDQAVLITRTQQLVPWFADVFSMTESFPRTVRVMDARFALTTRGTDNLFRIHAEGLEAAPPVTLGGKTRRVWRYRNDTPARPETGIVAEVSGSPHVAITTLQSYDKMAEIYAGIFKTKSAITPDISALAEKLTKGVSDRRAQAKILYDWVASQIQYVNIVLGAGGFVPHEAGAVLKNRYGDCKDHVMLLEALLAVKKIDSSAVLIRAGENQFQLPAQASPFLFDHLITYIPEFNMYLDSTSRYAPFGVLPAMNAGKSVVIVKTGKLAKTPAITATSSSLGSETVITIKEDGSAEGVTKIRSTGAASVDMRASMAMLPQDSESQVFRSYLGPGSDGKFQRGNPEALDGAYSFSAEYSYGHLATMPGPGALPSNIAFKPFSFSSLIGLDLPQSRAADYVCSSGTYTDRLTVILPKTVKSVTLPASRVMTAPGVELRLTYTQPQPGTVVSDTQLSLAQPGPVCKAADYDKIRPALQGMVNALQAQTIYQ